MSETQTPTKSVGLVGSETEETMSTIQERYEVAVENLPESVSPYELTKVISAVLGKVYEGPKAYRAIKDGRLASTFNELGKHTIEYDEAVRFLTKVVEGGTGSSSRVAGVLEAIKQM